MKHHITIQENNFYAFKFHNLSPKTLVWRTSETPIVVNKYFRINLKKCANVSLGIPSQSKVKCVKGKITYGTPCIKKTVGLQPTSNHKFDALLQNAYLILNWFIIL